MLYQLYQGIQARVQIKYEHLMMNMHNNSDGFLTLYSVLHIVIYHTQAYAI